MRWAGETAQKNMNLNLNHNGYLCSSRFEKQVEACLNNRPVAGAFLFGNAGTGKTYLAETLCKIEKAEKYFMQMFPGSREDDLLLKLIPDENSKSGIKLHDGVLIQAVKALQNSSDKIVYIILDEWDKTRPSADSFLLDFLQSGRINYNSYHYILSDSELARLKIFITMNDERELSEPLLRRLPVLHFEYLSAQQVKSALEMTHKENDYVENVVILYQKTIAAGLPKPATIQELRQLLDAISLLGNEADWDTLVFQFVTKTVENHNLLCDFLQTNENQELNEEIRQEVNPDEFTEMQEASETENDSYIPKLPSIIAPPGQKIIDNDKFESELYDSFSNVELNENNFNEFVKKADSLNYDSVSQLFSIVNDRILLKKNVISIDDKYRDIMSNLNENDELFLRCDYKIPLDFIRKEQIGNVVKIVNIDKNFIFIKEEHKYVKYECRYNVISNMLDIIATRKYGSSNYINDYNLELIEDYKNNLRKEKEKKEAASRRKEEEC